VVTAGSGDRETTGAVGSPLTRKVTRAVAIGGGNGDGVRSDRQAGIGELRELRVIGALRAEDPIDTTAPFEVDIGGFILVVGDGGSESHQVAVIDDVAGAGAGDDDFGRSADGVCDGGGASRAHFIADCHGNDMGFYGETGVIEGDSGIRIGCARPDDPILIAGPLYGQPIRGYVHVFGGAFELNEVTAAARTVIGRCCDGAGGAGVGRSHINNDARSARFSRTVRHMKLDGVLFFRQVAKPFNFSIRVGSYNGVYSIPRSRYSAV
jgi:hypothetical protein